MAVKPTEAIFFFSFYPEHKVCFFFFFLTRVGTNLYLTFLRKSSEHFERRDNPTDLFSEDTRPQLVRHHGSSCPDRLHAYTKRKALTKYQAACQLQSGLYLPRPERQHY